MTAKEMFKLLGMPLYVDNDYHIIYGNLDYQITFAKKYKMYWFSKDGQINYDLHKAITQQIKELEEGLK